MMKWAKRFVWVPVLFAAVWLMVANRTPVSISLDPFQPDNPALSTPEFWLWIWLMMMLFVGVALGALGQWISGRERRSQARDNRRELKAVKKELTLMKARLDEQAAGDEPPPLKLEATTL